MQIPAQLKELASKVSDTSSFIRRHGQLLSLVTSKFDEQMMSVLFPVLRSGASLLHFPGLSASSYYGRVFPLIGHIHP